MATKNPVLVPVNGPQPLTQHTASETYSRNIMGPVFFEMSNLRVGGSDRAPGGGLEVAPANSPFIVANTESFTASVHIEFNRTPLTRLLLCLGTKIKVKFPVEGLGSAATETELTAEITTEANKFDYALVYEGTPARAGLTEGFYMISAVAEIGPSNHPCAQFLFGAGYVAKVYLQVYDEAF